MAVHQYPIPVDTLPIEVGDAYNNLLDWLTDWLDGSHVDESPNIIDYYEHELAACDTPEIRVRYLARLNLRGGVNRRPFPQAADELKMWEVQVDVFRPVKYKYLEPYYPHHEREAFSDSHFYSWLAVRMTEAMCAHVGNSSLRSARQNLWAEWEAVQPTSQRYHVEDDNSSQLFRYLFGVLVPFANGSRTRSFSNVAEQFRQSVPRQTPVPRAPTPPPEPKPQTLQTLCQNGLTPVDVREVLAQLGAVDANTGYWPHGQMTGKAAKLKSAFPAVYRALSDKGLMLKLEGPAWRKIFIAEFEVDISLRMANYDTRGQASKVFHEYYAEAARWITIWRARRQSEH